MGERALIKFVTGHDTLAGPGDDAACIDVNGVRIVVSSDVVTFEDHMVRGMTMEQFGWLSAAVNFSDIASMGARPIGILAAVSLHPETDENDYYDIIKGIRRCAEYCGTSLIGGDTKAGHGSVCGTALGVCEHKILTRSGACPGDLVAVTGSLGSASAGWYAALNGIGDKDTFRAAARPVPRIKEGIFLSSNGIANSCMDISDGLSSTAYAICGSSGVGMDIVKDALPTGKGVHRISEELGLDADDLMLHGGGDYGLMFTFGREHLDLLKDMDMTVIGTVTEKKDVFLTSEGKKRMMENKGYEHFTQN
jgi:thiamine-monophosphate kinase